MIGILTGVGLVMALVWAVGGIAGEMRMRFRARVERERRWLDASWRR